jgi:hypothetical protein
MPLHAIVIALLALAFILWIAWSEHEGPEVPDGAEEGEP